MMPTNYRDTAEQQYALAAAQHSEGDLQQQQQFVDVFVHLRAADEARARAGDINGLWTSADSTIAHLSSRFVTEPAVDFRAGWSLQLQNLWYLFYVAGKYCHESHVAPLILQIVQTAQRELLSRACITSDGDIEEEQASVTVTVAGQTVEQLLWCDLPFLVPNMTDYWVRDCGKMSRSQRVRLSSFLASLAAASTSSWSDGLCSVALVVLRDALETERPLVRAGVEPGGEDGEDAGRATAMLTVADLLVAANAWLTRAGPRILQLCEVGDELNDGSMTAQETDFPVSDEVCRLGSLAARAGLLPVQRGFGTHRWFFWLRRLEEIGAEAPGSSGSEIEDSSSTGVTPFVQRVRAEKRAARQIAFNMVYVASQSDTRISRELLRIRRLPF